MAGNRKAEIAKAAWQLEDTMNEKFVTQYPDRSRMLEARAVQLKVQKAEKWSSWATVGMVMLSIFETPSWCQTDIDFFTYNDRRCFVNGTADNMLLKSNIAYLPPGFSLSLEVLLIGCIFNHLWLRKQVQEQFFDTIQDANDEAEEESQNKPVVYYPPGHFKFGLMCMALEFLDVIIFFVHPLGSFRFAVFSRTGILCLSPAVQKLASTVSKVIGEYISVAVFFAGFIAFFAWITVTIFDDLNEEVNGVKHPNKGFESLGESLNSFWIAGICEDFVAVFKDSYTAYRGAGLMWFVFVVVAKLLLLSLVLDTLCAAYRDKTKEIKESRNENIQEGITTAFKCLVRGTSKDDHTCDKEAFKEFLKEFTKSPSIPTIQDDHADKIFQAVDDDGSGFVERDEFAELCSVIQYQFWTAKKDSFVAHRFPEFWKGKSMTWFREFVNGSGFDNLMNCILLVNFILVITETRWDLLQIEMRLKNPSLGEVPDEPSWMENLEFGFSFVYVGEVACRLAVISWAEYTSSTANCFDFATTWLLLFSAILEKFNKSSLATYANMLRLLRLLRMVKALKNIPSVQFMIDTMIKLVQKSKDIVTLLFVLLFFFTTLSVQVFGGLLYKGNEGLEGEEYNEKNMFVLNFNDWPSAFGVWMVILLAEYRPEFPDACYAATKHSGTFLKHSWLMFPIFYVLGVSIVFELVKAFTIEVFVELKEKWEKKNKEKEGGGEEHHGGGEEHHGGEEKEEKEEGKGGDEGPLLEKIREFFREDELELHYKIIGVPLFESEGEEEGSESGSEHS